MSPTGTTPRRIGERGLKIIKQAEGLRLVAYLCPALVWTIGYGHTRGVKAGDTCTIEQAEAWLREDCADAEAAVSRLAPADLTQNQFDALVSFVFNVGTDAFAKSTLLRLLRAGDRQGAADQLRRWVKAGGATLAGLVLRRDAERNLFLAND